jgi:hypothetical protein
MMEEPNDMQVVPCELLQALEAESPSTVAAVSTNGSAQPSTNGAHKSRLMVEKWLTDRGAAFRIKSQPDGKGRTVYVLAKCPFDASHGDPDSCIMQAPDGKLSANCFHNSCQGRGWQAFKAAIGGPEPRHYDPPWPDHKQSRKYPDQRDRHSKHANDHVSAQEAGDGVDESATAGELPWIQANHRQLRYVTDDVLAALRTRNEPPAIFQRGGLLTRLRVRVESGAPYLEPLTDSALRGVLARIANWFKIHVTRQGNVEEEDAPPMEVVKDLAALPSWECVPPLEALVESPVLIADGQLIVAPGFHPASRLWYHPAADLKLPEISLFPTLGEIEKARHWLLFELLGDFPFEDDASRAHALAALLLPFVRLMIDGPTPLHLLDAPVEGTGKTLLAMIIGLVSTGREVESIAEAYCDEEWRKRITATLAEAPTFVLLDNLNRVLDTGALASVLTSRVWKDRILGFSKTARLPNTCVWLASGNNTRLSRELIRRTLLCRLDANLDAPWERSDFRHPNLIGWTKANRSQLVAAALTLCQAWIAAGRPPGGQTLGMFESWAETMGGILDVAGVAGLLANSRQFRAAHADKVSEWRAFVASWWQEYGERAVGVEELYRLATKQALLDSVLGDKGERSQRTRLGLAMSKALDRVLGEYRIESAGEDHKHRQQYRLRCSPSAQVASASIPAGEP